MMITVGAMTPLAGLVHVKVIRFVMHMKPTQCIVAVTTLCMPWQNTDCKKHGLNVRHIGPNINFFMNVPVTPDGQLKFDDGISGPGNMSKFGRKWI